MKLRYVLCLALCGLGSWHGLAAGAIHAKAFIAQQLLRFAWERGEAGEAHPRPWPWADMWPIARFRFPDREVDLIVLSDSSGRSLAFGPGHLPASVIPGDAGNAVLAGHRDTHFRFVQALELHDRFSITLPGESPVWFEVTDSAIVDSRETDLRLDGEDSMVSLVTCYPFDAIQANGPLRFVVVAHRVPAVEEVML